MRRIVPFVLAAIGCSGTTPHRDHTATGPAPAAKPKPGAEVKAKPDVPTIPDGEDVLAEVKEMNGPKYAPPAHDFRAGHVTKRTAPAATRTANGYQIAFPSGAPISTPAVYDGKLYVSGGFRSKEFYAFEASTGKPVWGLDLDDDGPSASACADGVCVFNTESCTTFAVDARTGEQLWSYWLGDPLTSAPTIAGGMVFTSYPAGAVEGDLPRPPNATHALVAFDLRTGKVKWQRWLDSDVMSAPVAAGEFLYVTTFAGTVMKLEPATGNPRYAIRARATSAPTVQFVDGRESMFFTKRAAAADEAQNGAGEMLIRTDDNQPQTRYTTEQKKAEYIDPKVQAASAKHAKAKDDDSANGFGAGAPSSAGAGMAMDMVGVESVSTMQQFQGSRVLRYGDANVNTMGDEVIATNADDGKQMWSLKLDGDVARDGGHLGTAPLAAGGRVLVATVKGEVLSLEPKTGKVQKRYPIGSAVRAQPVVADGWIFVGTEDGRLVAIDTHDRTLTGWPMWGGDAAHSGTVAIK